VDAPVKNPCSVVFHKAHKLSVEIRCIVELVADIINS